MSQSLKSNSTLQSLCITGCGITAAGLRALRRPLAQLDCLTDLNCSRAWVHGPAGVGAGHEAIVDMTSLWLVGMFLHGRSCPGGARMDTGNEGGAKLASLPAYCRSLVSLNLSCTYAVRATHAGAMTPTFIPILTWNALPPSFTLRCALVRTVTGLGDKGGMELARAMSSSDTVKRLLLDGTRVA